MATNILTNETKQDEDLLGLGTPQIQGSESYINTGSGLNSSSRKLSSFDFVPNTVEATNVFQTNIVQMPYNSGTAGQESCGWTIANNNPSSQSKKADGTVQYSGFNSGDGIIDFSIESWNTSKIIRIKFIAAVQPGATADDRFAFGLTETVAGAVFNLETSTAKGIKFVWRNDAGTRTLYTVTADGAAVTAISTTGYTFSATVFNLYEIVWTPSIDVKFYINGKLFSTHTTNLPTGGNPPRLAFENNNLNNTTASISNPIISTEI